MSSPSLGAGWLGWQIGLRYASAQGPWRWLTAEPDLVERLRLDAPLAPLNPATLYGGGAAAYTDYPTLAEQSRAAAPG